MDNQVRLDGVEELAWTSHPLRSGGSILVLASQRPLRPTAGYKFQVYATAKGLRLDIEFAGDTLWMSQAQIGQLFGRDVSTISRHVAIILEEGELDKPTSLQKTQTSLGRPSVLYSSDMGISVDYRVSSARAAVFRRWATTILVQFAKKGFVVDTPRLKQPENSDRISELREIIRDIRSTRPTSIES